MPEPGTQLLRRARHAVEALLPACEREGTVTVFHPEPGTEHHWVSLFQRFSGGVDHDGLGPLARVLGLMQTAGCRTVVVEERYIDPDYRSEYSAFWSRRFESTPDSARRLH